LVVGAKAVRRYERFRLTAAREDKAKAEERKAGHDWHDRRRAWLRGRDRAALPLFVVGVAVRIKLIERDALLITAVTSTAEGAAVDVIGVAVLAATRSAFVIACVTV
jgi:predicted pyridoxine 5'-phosphate oxidase superfamily flavin-nucleotide-binding protein